MGYTNGSSETSQKGQKGDKGPPGIGFSFTADEHYHIKKIGPQCVHVWLTRLSCFDIKRMWFVLEFLLVELTSDYG